jgi:hypothetical protein
VSGLVRGPAVSRQFVAAGLLLALALMRPGELRAQVDGSASLLVDVLPDVSEAAGAQTVEEVRLRLFVERVQRVGEHVRLNLSGYVDGLARGGSEPSTGDAILRPGDLYAEFAASRFDVRAGMSRLAWGRLDELQPTDVVNPIDLARFLLEGRSEARLPIALVRGRFLLRQASTIEAVVVPAFRRSRFDQLDEETSPFDLAGLPGVPRSRDDPPVAWSNVQGGARFTTTSGRVDWGISAYRGRRSFPVLSAQAGALVESFPRFTMIGGDFETVKGPWGVRGEAAAFVKDELQSTRLARGVPGRTIDAGVGVDRRTGVYRVAANVLWSWRSVDSSTPLGRALEGDEELERQDVSLIVALDRSFARETRTVRVFGVYDPADRTVFGRAIVNVSLRDNLALEGSGGLFAGESLDTLGRLTRRDFLYARLKVFF